MTDIVVFCLWGGGTIFTALTGLGHRARPLWALLAAVCAVLGVLAGLARGMALTALLTPMLALCAAAMAALLFGKGNGQG